MDISDDLAVVITEKPRSQVITETKRLLSSSKECQDCCDNIAKILRELNEYVKKQ